MRRIASTWVPHFLTTEQMQQYVEACHENLTLIAEDLYSLESNHGR